jgi:hypothetical protein
MLDIYTLRHTAWSTAELRLSASRSTPSVVASFWICASNCSPPSRSRPSLLARARSSSNVPLHRRSFWPAMVRVCQGCK